MALPRSPEEKELTEGDPVKTAKFPFLTMDYSPWSSKNLIEWNRLKIFMQVGIDV